MGVWAAHPRRGVWGIAECLRMLRCACFPPQPPRVGSLVSAFLASLFTYFMVFVVIPLSGNRQEAFVLRSFVFSRLSHDRCRTVDRARTIRYFALLVRRA